MHPNDSKTLRWALDRILDLGFPGQAEVLEHGHAHALEASVPERLGKLSARLVN